jgi:uncharacterized protein YydD (DUF2326 family)
MKLSKLYSNKPDTFSPVDFVPGLNIVLGEIRLPENRNRDTHNLGKTTLGRLLDFCFLSRYHKNFFLFKNSILFKDFIFFLELELEDSSYVTIRRSVEEASKIAFKRHEACRQDLSALSLTDWDHQNIPFDRARELLDGMLDWRTIKPFKYRNVLGYLLRSQEDFREVFQLNKFKSKQSNWIPFLANLLGFNAQLVNDRYEKVAELSDKKTAEKTIKRELNISANDISKIEGLLQLKSKEAEKKQTFLNTFDFRSQDKELTCKVVEEVDEQIAMLNAERYSLTHIKKKVQSSLHDDQILFNPEEAQRLFAESNILFQGQIKKDFQQLIAFNRAVTEERRFYLQEEFMEIEKKLKQINSELNDLGKKRSEILSFLSETDVFNKYKQLSDEMVQLRTDIASLENQRNNLHQLQALRTEIRALTEEDNHLHDLIESEIFDKNSEQESLFSAIRSFFNEIVEEVLDRKALLSVALNLKGNLEFKAEILDESGTATSADLGHTYRKLLCFAFDLAVMRAHLNEKFPHFVFHDGVLESLDDRKKINLIAVVRKYACLGLQPIITLIDSDLPILTENNSSVFTSDEIVLTLHDEGDHGRLFKMKTW